MKKFKKFLSLTVSLCMFFSFNVYALNDFNENGIVFKDLEKGNHENLSYENIDYIIETEGTLGLSAKQYAKHLKRTLDKRKFTESELVMSISCGIEEFKEKWKDDKDIESFEDCWKEIGIYKVNLRKKGRNNVIKVMDKLAEDDNVKYVHPNFIYEPAAVPKSYNFCNTITTAYEQIEAPRGWDYVGDHTVRVGVMDTGIDNISDILTVNRDLSTSHTQSISTASCTCNLYDKDTHGNCVASIIASNPENTDTSICGLGRKVELVSYKVADVDTDHGANTDKIITKINKANSDNIKVLNFSFGLTQPPATGEMANGELDGIKAFNGVFVKAAGNAGHDDNLNQDKANYKNVPNLIVVGAVDKYDNLADFSDYGTETVHIAAPGVNLSMYDKYGKVVNFSGTSFSAPMVAAAAELIYTINPNFTAAQVKNFVLNGADVVPQLNGKIQGARRLNVRKAMQLATSRPEKLRIAYTNSANELYMKQNALNAQWSCISAGVTQFSLDGNNVAILKNDANKTCYVKKKYINGAWEPMGNGCKAVKIKGRFVAMHKTNNTLAVRNIDNFNSLKIFYNVKSFDLDNNRLIYTDLNNNLYVCDGDITQAPVEKLTSDITWAWCRNGMIHTFDFTGNYVYWRDNSPNYIYEYAVPEVASITLNRVAYIKDDSTKMMRMIDHTSLSNGANHNMTKPVQEVKLDRYNIYAIMTNGNILAKTGAHNAQWDHMVQM